jgi:hypothetical protein
LKRLANDSNEYDIETMPSGHAGEDDGYIHEQIPDARTMMKKLRAMIGLGGELGPDFRLYVDQLKALKTKLSKKLLHIAVIGSTDLEKSSLINHIIGKEILPLDMIPGTVIPIYVIYGERPGVNIHHIIRKNIAVERYETYERKTLTWILHQFVSEATNPCNVKEIKKVELAHPSALLRQGVAIITMPGMNAGFDYTSADSKILFSQLDVVICVAASDSSAAETDPKFFLMAAQNAAAALFIIMINSENTGQHNRNRLISNLKEKYGIHGALGFKPAIFLMSPRMHDFNEHENATLPCEKTDIDEFASYLTKLIRENKERLLLVSTRKNMDRVFSEINNKIQDSIASLESARNFLIEKRDSVEKVIKVL